MPEEAQCIVIDAKTLSAQKLTAERIREELEKKLRKIGKGDFVIFEGYDELLEEIQLYILHLIEERQTAEEYSQGRYVLTLENGDCYEEYRKKLTFIRVTLPELSERSQVEKEMLISYFLKKEEQRLGKQIRISERAYRILSQHLFTENVGELEHCVKQLCAKAFSVRRSQKEIRIDLLMLPKELLLGIQMEFQRQLGEEKYLTLSELRQDSEVYREIRLYSQVLDKFEQFRKNLLNVFSLQNVVEALTILNVGRVLSQVDASGELLLNVVKYHPFLIKPNHHELGEMFHTECRTTEEIVRYAGELQKLGAENVLVSMAGEGAFLLTVSGEQYQIGTPKGQVVNSVGAGDSMVAGFLAGYDRTGDYREALKLGTAAGSATAFSEGLAGAAEIEALYRTL